MRCSRTPSAPSSSGGTQADYRDALRPAATDDDPELRERGHGRRWRWTGDEYVQRLLVDGLRDPTRPLGAAAARTSVDRLRRARRALPAAAGHRRDGQAAERCGAQRCGLLAADSNAADLFADIAADKSEDPAARSTSAIALQSLSPDQFQDVARDVLLDDDDNDKVKATIVNAIAHHESAPDAEVEQKVRSMAEPEAPAGAAEDRGTRVRTPAGRRHVTLRHTLDRGRRAGPRRSGAGRPGSARRARRAAARGRRVLRGSRVQPR